MITMFGTSVRATRLALVLLLPVTLAAQPMAPQPTRQSIAQIADSVAAIGDTARAVALLDSAVRRDKRDAASWHQLGLLLWNQARSARNPDIMKDQKKIRMLIAADTSLRLATKLAPDSGRFWLSLSRFNLQSGVSTMRFASTGQAREVMTAAERVNDKVMLAEAADMAGMGAWRRYDAQANRGLPTGFSKIVVPSGMERRLARDYVNTIANKIEPPTGDADHAEALDLFSRAVGADSSNLMYSRHLYMAYVERKRWTDVVTVASMRARQFPLDFQSQLALGLAYHRLANEKGATIAFDSAFALMDDNEANRLKNLVRIMRPRPRANLKGTEQVADSASWARLPSSQREGLEAMFWMMSDPLALTQENEFRLEFLARVVYADFRWTVDDLNLRGADTDRGDVYVRYGPPDFEMTIPGSTTDGRQRLDGEVTLFWDYTNSFTFFFDLKPGYATGRLALFDRDYVERLNDVAPVSFANVPVTRLLDTIPMRIARFRSGADSTDALIAALVPIDSLVRGNVLERVPVDIDLRVFDQFVRVRGMESDQLTFARDSSAGSLGRLWSRRLGPGINVVRVEALQGDSKRGARAMARLDPATNVGFGMSDVLLGNKPELRSGVVTPSRWRDIAITPSVGSYARGSSLGLLWEMYDLVPKDGQTKYRVAITVERADRDGVAGFTLRVLDNLGRAVGRAQQSRDRFTISFDRQGGALPVLVEYLSLDMTQAPSGGYRMRVEVTDLANQKKTARNTEFRIR
ncbi:GWxTD domain-containing protein [Gemmatimonas groenlandica]|uniref:GWxTD domain-containing protein n=1 Tax=Gemmatimonas groenlandica TaxID=2732249 RepID=A0A6M4IPX7_9BACT|nr:GWxTD domain-containing protein [Gemmatimonas groenlandica]QJR36145.1 GWxTD domain-containing protein [Gemmatimonas groenlandica]